MKLYFPLLSAAVLMLAACSQEPAKPAESAPAQEAVSAPQTESAPAAADVPSEQASAPAASAAEPAPEPAAASPAETPAEPETKAEAKPEAAADAGGDVLATGKKVFDGLCFGCHSANIAIPGSPRLGNKEDWAPRIKKGKDTLFKHAIEGFTDKGMMPAKGGNPSLSDDEVKAAVLYMVHEAGGKL